MCQWHGFNKQTGSGYLYIKLEQTSGLASEMHLIKASYILLCRQNSKALKPFRKNVED